MPKISALRRAIALPALALLGWQPAHAATATAAPIVRHPAPDPAAPILVGVTVPAGAQTLLLSGQVPPVNDTTADPASIAAYGDTRTQALGVFRKIDTALKAQGFALGDVVKLTVYLVGDPAKGGKLDFAGFSQAYAQFFGTPEQPNKVARTTVQVAALANPGFLVEVEAVAAKVR
ncbi:MULTISPECIES: RidA family protein [unclassified Novosphingobium]|uniref:RidA family protein n=1 Tax=unclassified Novosphingobium TaxID=2644732 RepID=UPI001445E3E0|nr:MULTISPECIES: RidA family protein [unclassified Novosphingobium]NKJ44164.1 enamine deaminase RidA (YjgF/YER057c/UK114 family) [Novosphingobium sp. SG720]NMN04938.1 enamine deaminase RidA (YjgF/YER057c/UK114 family) [Novosphingobium sp. SG919]NMN87231.1 enamine deaminase RidA (YjgF/YER057c/UK114 family) [Novosphingobium sp. SG916]